jgi:ABC-type Mn2+/Zn2+ transport system permease subunit
MNGDTQHCDEDVRRIAGLKMRVAGIVGVGVVVSLVLAPEALARIISNHNETVLVLD